VNVLLIVLMISVLFCTISILELRGRLRETTRVIKLLGEGYERLFGFAQNLSEAALQQDAVNISTNDVLVRHAHAITEISESAQALLNDMRNQFGEGFSRDEPTSH
jgi:hypothetical protein